MTSSSNELAKALKELTYEQEFLLKELTS